MDDGSVDSSGGYRVSAGAGLGVGRGWYSEAGVAGTVAHQQNPRFPAGDEEQSAIEDFLISDLR